jgi:hypothetical protein|tara:strand:- start:395 stop:733 length:339 start_codon:yes stop_codon:yes gene_type:complete
MSEYVMVTGISTFRMKYCVRLSDLQKDNPDSEVQPEWALDAVTMEEVEEFSQRHIGENIIDHRVMNETEVLEMFDKENEYLRDLTTQEKLEKFIWPAYNKRVGEWKRNNREY